VDATVIEANASRYHGKAPHELDWTDEQRQRRAVAEYLAALDAEARPAAAGNDGNDTDVGSSGDDQPREDRNPR
jgi:hypothetical protein